MTNTIQHEQRPFGHLADGRAVTLYTMRLPGGMAVSVTDYGAAVVSILVPDQHGEPTDVILGYDCAEDYENGDCYLGATVGRCANRIAFGKFRLNDKDYTLAINNGENTNHGGLYGFNAKMWAVAQTEDGLTLRYTSPDGEEGFPGCMQVCVKMTLAAPATLRITLEAVSDADTLCNLTNHCYFNLSGFASGSIEGQKMQIFADAYTPINASSVPTGEILPVVHTPLDFRKLTGIGARINEDHVQLRCANGYDHNWVLGGSGLREAAYAVSDETGITLHMQTTLPGLQLYTGNFLGGPAGKNGAAIAPRTGFALEAQYFPNAVNTQGFETPLLKAGECMQHEIVWKFGTVPEANRHIV